MNFAIFSLFSLLNKIDSLYILEDVKAQTNGRICPWNIQVYKESNQNR